jgi:signal transduction histidine kinase
MEKREIKKIDVLTKENEELKMMMRKLSHEMGNAITLLGGSIFYLEHELKNAKDMSRVIDLKADYEYLCHLFNQLREYNHYNGGEKQPICLSQLMESGKSIFAKLKKELISPDIEINYHGLCQDDITDTYVYGNKVKLQQVFINIIKNSMEAMVENEKSDNKNDLYLSMSIVDDIVHIEIRDTGKGISEKNIQDIFKPMSTFGKKNGVGLGLAVVRKIIEDHQGKIEAVSALGAGTAIHIYLPIMKQ